MKLNCICDEGNAVGSSVGWDGKEKSDNVVAKSSTQSTRAAN